MDKIRGLEQRFFKEIIFHLKQSLCKIPDSFFNIRESSGDEDTKLSFDLVFDLGFTVSVRIRKYCYIKYNDLTIRSKTKNGGRTEIDKIMEGKAQVYFYAYMNKEETEFSKVRILDVDSIRTLTTKGDYSSNKNDDGTEFYTYLFSDIAAIGGAIYKKG